MMPTETAELVDGVMRHEDLCAAFLEFCLNAVQEALFADPMWAEVNLGDLIHAPATD